MSASILVVEDNVDNMKLITWLLEDAGFTPVHNHGYLFWKGIGLC